MKKLIVAIALLAIMTGAAEARHHRHGGRTPWCGIYMMKYTGHHKSGLAKASNWAREGSNAGGPGEGVIVVWPHHVGIIVGRSGSGWMVHSGNDGNAVRTRVRSLAGAIAFRSLGGGSSFASYQPEESTPHRRHQRHVRTAQHGWPPFEARWSFDARS